MGRRIARVGKTWPVLTGPPSVEKPLETTARNERGRLMKTRGPILVDEFTYLMNGHEVNRRQFRENCDRFSIFTNGAKVAARTRPINLVFNVLRRSLNYDGSITDVIYIYMFI